MIKNIVMTIIEIDIITRPNSYRLKTNPTHKLHHQKKPARPFSLREVAKRDIQR